MPHRTVFQWGKNHAHPFTVFVGGFVIGALVTGAVMYAWQIAGSIEDNSNSAVVQPAATKSPKATVSPSVSPSQSPTASPRVQF